MGRVYRIVTCSERAIAWRDERKFFSSVPGTNVRNYAGEAGGLEFRVSGIGKTTFEISEFEPSSEVVIYCDGKEAFRAQSDERGAVFFDMETSSAYSAVRMTGKLARCHR
jgi:hypothetical protein